MPPKARIDDHPLTLIILVHDLLGASKLDNAKRGVARRSFNEGGSFSGLPAQLNADLQPSEGNSTGDLARTHFPILDSPFGSKL